MIKESIVGVRCEFSDEQKDCHADEFALVVNERRIFMKKRHVCLLNNAEKFAVIGESPLYIHPSGIVNLIGPSKRREFWLTINSRGYLEGFFIRDSDLIFNF